MSNGLQIRDWRNIVVDTNVAVVLLTVAMTRHDKQACTAKTPASKTFNGL